MLCGERINMGNTGYTIFPSAWNTSFQRAQGRTPEIRNINLGLERISNKLHDIFHRLEYTEDLSLENIKAIYKGKDISEGDEYILQFFTKTLENTTALLARNTINSRLWSYNLLKKFIAFQYNKSDYKIKDLDKKFILNFEQYLVKQHQAKPSSIRKAESILKSIIQKAIEEHLTNINPFQGHRLPRVTCNRQFLTEMELMSIIKYKPHIERLAIIKDLFLIAAFTGISWADISILTPENIIQVNGKYWIVFVRKKTQKQVSIPLFDIPLQLIHKRTIAKNNTDILLEQVSYELVRAGLREIAAACRISKPLSFHIARHTFGTMALSAGVPMESIAKMMGHTTIKSTQIYAQVTDQKISEDMDKLIVKREEGKQ